MEKLSSKRGAKAEPRAKPEANEEGVAGEVETDGGGVSALGDEVGVKAQPPTEVTAEEGAGSGTRVAAAAGPEPSNEERKGKGKRSKESSGGRGTGTGTGTGTGRRSAAGAERAKQAHAVLDSKTIEELVPILLHSKGNPVISGIIRNLESGEAISDDDLAALIGVKVNMVRTELNELYANGMVSFEKRKIPNQKWYAYFWKLDMGNINYLIQQRIKKVIDILNKRLNFEMNHSFFYCPRDGKRYTFEESLENGFRCVDCGTPLVAQDNREIVERLKSEVSRLTQLLETISGEKATR